jgi:hypothetical protein
VWYRILKHKERFKKINTYLDGREKERKREREKERKREREKERKREREKERKRVIEKERKREREKEREKERKREREKDLMVSSLNVWFKCHFRVRRHSRQISKWLLGITNYFCDLELFNLNQMLLANMNWKCLD